MKTLYGTTDILAKLRAHLMPFFDGFARKTKENLLWIVIAMLAVGCARSVRNLHTDFLADLDLMALTTLYCALSKAKRPMHRAFARVIAYLAIEMVPDNLKKVPCFLVIDDTLIPKYGKKFAGVSVHFDHAAHDGKPYKNGHCFVCAALCVPVGTDQETKRIRYLSVPLVLSMWHKGSGISKLQIAHDLLLQLRDALQGRTDFVLLADSWYPKAALLRILDEWTGLQFIGAVRIDTVMYDLPPARTGKRGRPRKRGERLRPDDFTLRSCALSRYRAGSRPVLTELFGARQVTAFVTCPAGGTGSRRLYLSTMTCHDTKKFVSGCIRFCEADDSEIRPLLFYEHRWMIEVIFYELKTFWSIEDYMVRSDNAIDLLLNLIVVAYSLTKLLPYIDEDFSAWQQSSPQETRFRIGKLISLRIFLCKLGRDVQSTKNKSRFEEALSRHLAKFIHLR